MNKKSEKSNEKFLEKIVKKNYNNELEKILEKKAYSEDTKSLLLNMFYKIDIGYKDYKEVKINVETKENYVEEILRIILNKCNDIRIIGINSEEAKILGKRTFSIDKRNKRIICQPIERKLLYSIAKIDKKDKIVKNKYYILDRSISELINVGNSINMVEPIRDFNGYSWTSILREIESIEHNIIYQNLRILVGDKLLNKWVKDEELLIDNYEVFKNELEEKYGREIANYLIKILETLSILLMIKFDKKIKKELITYKKETEKNLEELKNKEELVKRLTLKKMDIIKKIKKTDEIINDRDYLEKEYIKRNKKLPLEKKIFSIRILVKVIKEERKELLKEISEINSILNPKQFIKYKKEQEQRYNYLKISEIEDIEKEIEKYNLKFQKIFFRALKIKFNKIKTKKELRDLIYVSRYYMLLQYDIDRKIYEVKGLKRQASELVNEIILKTREFKLLEQISENELIETIIVNNILKERTINLEDIEFKIIKEKENIKKNIEKKYYLEVINNEIVEEKIVLENLDEKTEKEITKHLNKKINIFI